jgi:hypothetical protein
MGFIEDRRHQTPSPRYHPDNCQTAGGHRDVLDDDLLLRLLAFHLRKGLELLGEQPQEPFRQLVGV